MELDEENDMEEKVGIGSCIDLFLCAGKVELLVRALCAAMICDL